jgi:hypothetical protein
VGPNISKFTKYNCQISLSLIGVSRNGLQV